MHTCILILQLSNTDSCLIWTTTSENAKHLKQLSEDSFIDAVNDAFVSCMSYFKCSILPGYILLTSCRKHLHDHIISLRGEV
jgi:uncharacterized protein (UPF0262 family)